MHKNPPQLSANADADRTVWLMLALVFTALVLFAGQAWSDELETDSVTNLTLVELYTSQGCSSCPPADTFLKELAQRTDVLALSFHVDYWDSETWQDPFSSPSFSLRQRNYQDAMAAEYIYTPQVIVNGDFAAPGGQRTEILDVIDNRLPAKAVPDLSISQDGRGGVLVQATESAVKGPASLYLAVFSPSEITRVRGGENRGRTLTNVNIVRRLIKVAPYEGRDATFNFSRRDLDAALSDGVAVFVQSVETGSILTVSALMPQIESPTRLSMNATGTAQR